MMVMMVLGSRKLEHVSLILCLAPCARYICCLAEFIGRFLH